MLEKVVTDVYSDIWFALNSICGNVQLAGGKLLTDSWLYVVKSSESAISCNFT